MLQKKIIPGMQSPKSDKNILPDGKWSLLERMHQPAVVCRFLDKEIVPIAVSEGFCEMFGYTQRSDAYSDIKGNLFRDVHLEDSPGLANEILRFGTGDGRLEDVYRIRKKGEYGYRIVRVNGEHLDCGDGVVVSLLWFTDEGDYREESGIDVSRTASKGLRERSIDAATRYDYLTGLPNLSYFFELADEARRTMLDQGGLPAILYLDLSGMKHYNHKHGFSEGDKMLKLFARLLARTFNAARCCHVGADRYAAIADENGLEDKLHRLFKEWRQLGDDKYLPICVGIYPNRIEKVTVGMAYDRAKIACDDIKGTYTSSYNYFSDKLNEVFEKRQFIIENFDKALARKWIQVYYQPIIRGINGKVCDEEALARWIDPIKGFLSPADFIPFLEEAGLIYKLDLYVLDRILEHIKIKEAMGLYIVPHSLNLSRSDFEACDMVEEICKRVDAAGVGRGKISIEITESIIGSDLNYIKDQVERFQALGFPVWMDDFGSGYSSLDVLQSIKFDLLKFDMNFMRKLDESKDGRIILTELMKMAMSLGIDTICEGVETEDQVHFLQEIGCSKLQGYYFSKPAPFDDILSFHCEHRDVGYENPEESDYYGTVCGVNLYDVGVIAREDRDTLQNTYNTLPMCIIEIKDDKSRFVRSNKSYREFFIRFFGLDLLQLGFEYAKADSAFMDYVIKKCSDHESRVFYDEMMPDGSIVHSFARRIGVNPFTGAIAIAVAVLSIREPNEKLRIDQILSVIEDFGETMPGGFFIYRADGNEELLYANRVVCDIFGCENLDEFKALTGYTFKGMVHPDDYERISISIEEQIKESQADLDYVKYRIIRKNGEVRWIDDYGHFIKYDDQHSLYYVFISDITEKSVEK